HGQRKVQSRSARRQTHRVLHAEVFGKAGLETARIFTGARVPPIRRRVGGV
ncbi:uncharacterized protein METZ01_LOCUS403618, partial [marine metagenome]